MTLYIVGGVALALIVLLRWNRNTMAALQEQISLVSPDETGVRNLLAQDQRIAAIHLTRKVTGLGLKESKDLVEAMARGEQVSFDQLPDTGLDGLLAAAKDGQVHALLRQGDKIGAIKRWRALTGASLAEAHDAIETLARGLPGAPGRE
ncbi:MAG TPA: ribosomal protein L7/L12 [Gemmatimonadales bacterium]|nr:ribosomal protein L7/L12 [Gemmatimonadales bacterium]